MRKFIAYIFINDYTVYKLYSDGTVYDAAGPPCPRPIIKRKPDGSWVGSGDWRVWDKIQTAWIEYWKRRIGEILEE